MAKTDSYTAARNLERKLAQLKTARADTIGEYREEYPDAVKMLHAQGLISNEEAGVSDGDG